MDKVIDIKDIPFKKTDNYFILDVSPLKYEFLVENNVLRYYNNNSSYEDRIYLQVDSIIEELGSFKKTDITNKSDYLTYKQYVETLKDKITKFNTELSFCLKEKEIFNVSLSKNYANLFNFLYPLIRVDNVIYKTELKENNYWYSVLVSPL